MDYNILWIISFFYLQTMIEWLTQRPSTLLSSWLIHMMYGLRKSGRFSVLIEITHGTLEKVCISSGLEMYK